MKQPSFAQKITKFTQKELDLFFQNAKTAKKNQAFTILTKATTKPHGRLLVIASAKYGNSPTRNLLRRRLKAIFHEEKLFERGLDCIVIARPTGKLYEFDDLKKLLLEALTTA